ncbi:Checkpoint protein HUS1-like Protein [Tribolium castaneum]|uniref:Checkpoint protein n=1 Tax=Tribolium castaneum TaxID=7070 RepID=A0A139WEK8_TRICA|nr:PREDICTED: checkpoint protein HUS1 [Tribolium castaneum]KYB26297.1 Checkpoint protein HUS1-like Protein [Tribolium castaneum]|eukprot:XP_008195631.1 PREDICTED: checkpoint protein HUS1 [Tribolium castaneum]
MKFRGLITDTSVMKDFMNIATGLSRFSKECVMRITERKVYFIISDEDNGPRRPLAWCELPVSFYFREYNLVGVTEEHNEIYLEFSTALLARSLSILKQNVKSLKIKLTNKDSPCLTLEMEMASEATQSRQCVHDIPVEVISRKHWNDYEEPRFNDFHVSIEMPNLKTIKTIVERMRNMSHSLTVAATKDGRLTFQIKTNIVTLSSHFPGLGVESFAIGQLELTSSDSQEEDQQKVSSIVDIKKFLMFLSGMQLNSCRTVCSIVHGKMVKLFMEQPGALSLQIFLTQLSI